MSIANGVKLTAFCIAAIATLPRTSFPDNNFASCLLKETAIFLVPLMVQDFDRRPNPNCPFNHAQANLTTHEQQRRLHEKFFAPGVKNRRFPSPKTKPCEKLKKPFLFAFGHSHSFPSFFLFFSRFTPALSNSKQIWPQARKMENLPMYRNLHWSHRWRGWSHRWRRLASLIFFFS